MTFFLLLLIVNCPGGTRTMSDAVADDNCHRWFNAFKASLAQTSSSSSDDLFYLVHNDGRVEARRNEDVDQMFSLNVNWQDSCLLNLLCSGNTFSTVTVCYRQGNGWMIDKQGTWQVYGSPFELSNEDRDCSSPSPVYPNVQFILNDEIEIVVKQGNLLCIELHGPDTHQSKHHKATRNSPFRPAASPNQLLFQGSVDFTALATCWLERKSTTQFTTPMPITMNGPGGQGQVKILIWAERRRSLFGKITHQLPSQLVIKMVNLSINIKDHQNCYISDPAILFLESIDG